MSFKKIFIKEVKGTYRGEEYIDTKPNFVSIAIFAVCMLICLAAIFGSFRIVPTGSTAIRVRFGQVSETVLEPGFHGKIPFVDTIVSVNNKQQDETYVDKIWSESSERTAVYFENTTVTYTICPEESAWIYANVNDYKHTLITSQIVASSIKSASKELNSTDVTNRGKIEPKIQEKLQKSLNDKYGKQVVIINKVTVSNIDFEETYQTAIAEKQNAQMAYEKQQIANKQAIEKAEADAQVKEKTAEADAKATITKAEAQAKANKLLNDSITDKILDSKYYDKWDGKLPSVVTDGNAIISIPSGE